MNIASSDNDSWDTLQRDLDASFLQSSGWGLFQQALGHNIYKIHGDNWSCLLIENQSKLGRYVFAPYGPTLAGPKLWSSTINHIADYCSSLGVNWARIETCLGVSIDSNNQVKGITKVLKAPKQVNPNLTRIIDLKPAEQDIMAGFSQSTRSIIRKNYRNPELTFKTSCDPKDIKYFLSMINSVSKRNKVFFHSDRYFTTQADTLMPLGVMRLELALLDNKPIACIVMHDFNYVTTYTYAASLPEARTTNASTLLLWQAILNAKLANMSSLDLFGIAPEDAKPSHPWYGFSAFKRKFGGTIIRRGDTLDIPIKRSYYIYRSAVKASRLF